MTGTITFKNWAGCWQHQFRRLDCYKCRELAWHNINRRIEVMGYKIENSRDQQEKYQAGDCLSIVTHSRGAHMQVHVRDDCRPIRFTFWIGHSVSAPAASQIGDKQTLRELAAALIEIADHS